MSGCIVTLIKGTTTLAASLSDDSSNTFTIEGAEGGVYSLGALATLTPGTGVAEALAINVGSAGSLIINGGQATADPASSTPLTLNPYSAAQTAPLEYLAADSCGAGANQGPVLLIGTNSATYSIGVDAGVLSARNITNSNGTGSGSPAHGFSDNNYFSRSGPTGYASFDSRWKIQGTNTLDHAASFQSYPVHNSSGNVATGLWGLVHSLTVSGGATVPTAYGVEIRDNVLSNGSTVTTNYGVYIDSLTSGGTNYSVYTSGTTPSYFGGALFTQGIIYAQGGGGLRFYNSGNNAYTNFTVDSSANLNLQAGASTSTTFTLQGAFNIALQTFSGGSWHEALKVTNTQQLKLAAYTTSGILLNDSSGNITSNTAPVPGNTLSATSVTVGNTSGITFTTSGSHELAQYQLVVFSGTVAPTNITFGTAYYVSPVNFSATVVSVSTTLANAIAGIIVAYTAAGTAVEIASAGSTQFPAISVVTPAGMLGSGATAALQQNSIVVGGAMALPTTATDGFLYVPTCSGTPTGTPTAQGAALPLVYDTSGHILWAYDGGWKQPKTAGGVAVVSWQ